MLIATYSHAARSEFTSANDASQFGECFISTNRYFPSFPFLHRHTHIHNTHYSNFCKCQCHSIHHMLSSFQHTTCSSALYVLWHGHRQPFLMPAPFLSGCAFAYVCCATTGNAVVPFSNDSYLSVAVDGTRAKERERRKGVKCVLRRMREGMHRRVFCSVCGAPFATAGNGEQCSSLR